MAAARKVFKLFPFVHSSGILGKLVDILDVYLAFNLISLFNEE